MHYSQTWKEDTRMLLSVQIVLVIGIVVVMVLMFFAVDPLRQYSKADRQEIKTLLQAKDYGSLGRWVKAKRGIPADKFNDEAIGTLFAAQELNDLDAMEKLEHDLYKVNQRLHGRPLFRSWFD